MDLENEISETEIEIEPQKEISIDIKINQDSVWAKSLMKKGELPANIVTKEMTEKSNITFKSSDSTITFSPATISIDPLKTAKRDIVVDMKAKTSSSDDEWEEIAKFTTWKQGENRIDSNVRIKYPFDSIGEYKFYVMMLPYKENLNGNSFRYGFEINYKIEKELNNNEMCLVYYIFTGLNNYSGFKLYYTKADVDNEFIFHAMNIYERGTLPDYVAYVFSIYKKVNTGIVNSIIVDPSEILVENENDNITTTSKDETLLINK